jgi:hypothetical protein
MTKRQANELSCAIFFATASNSPAKTPQATMWITASSLVFSVMARLFV